MDNNAIGKDTHRNIHKNLHKNLDLLVADFIGTTGRLPSKTTVWELMEWSYLQTLNRKIDDINGKG